RIRTVSSMGEQRQKKHAFSAVNAASIFASGRSRRAAVERTGMYSPRVLIRNPAPALAFLWIEVGRPT
ncbi:MAG: hypothetical protein ACOY7J_14540, partial [Pseudomonadota bacterium]